MFKITNTLLLFALVSDLFGQTNLYKSVIEKSKPAVISITTFDNNGNAISSGTGFFIDDNGTLLSNYHVFVDAKKAIVKTISGKEYLINNIISQNRKTDIIKCQISNELSEKFSFLQFRTDEIVSGDDILIIGNPLGLEFSVSNGIVSAIRIDETIGKVIQFNAPISPGNSGSPLIDMKGLVAGIVSYQYEGGQNLNFAVSINELNLLEPVNKLVFPENIEKDKTISKKDFCRYEFGTSLIKIKGLERNSYFNEVSSYLEQVGLDMGNNYSEALFYDSIKIGKIIANVGYKFEHSYLTSIEIKSQTLRQGEFYPNTKISQLKYVDFTTTFNEFLEIKKYLEEVYGPAKNWSSRMTGCSKCFLGNPKEISDYSEQLEKITISNQYNYVFGWTDYTNNTDVRLWCLFSGKRDEPPYNYKGLWSVLISKIKE